MFSAYNEDERESIYLLPVYSFDEQWDYFHVCVTTVYVKCLLHYSYIAIENLNLNYWNFQSLLERHRHRGNATSFHIDKF